MSQLLNLKLLLALDTLWHTRLLRELEVDQVITLGAHDSGGTVHHQQVRVGLRDESRYRVQVVEMR